MADDPYSQNNQLYNQYTPSGYEKAKLGKILLLVVGVLAAIIIAVLIVHFLQSNNQQNKYLKSATAAARKQIPNAKVRDIKVAGGFALAIVSNPDANGQAADGNTTIFKVNADGSMKQLANGSSFSPLELLELGIPLTAQAPLTGSTVGQVKQNLANACNYEGGSAPGYSGFDVSFNPGGWQIDSATLSGLEQALSNTISSQDAGVNLNKVVICVNATREGSNLTTDTSTYISTFTLQVQFITSDGTLSMHTVMFATGPNYYHSYTLDGRDITSSTPGVTGNQ